MLRIYRILWVAAALGLLHGQTQLDLHFQSKDIDFSTANATRPFKAGTTLPSTCAVGEMFFMLNAPAGANVFGCTSLNAWTLETLSGSGSGASTASQLGDFAVTRTSSTVLTIGATCLASSPCNIRVGNLVYAFVSPVTCTISAGSAQAFIYVSGAGALICGSNGDTLGGSATLATGISAFPADATPIWTWTAASTPGNWDASGGVDKRGFLSSQPLIAGAGVNVANISGEWQPSLDLAYLSLQGNLLWAQLAIPNAWTAAGAPQLFLASATRGPVRLGCGSIPTAMLSGEEYCTTAGHTGHSDGTTTQTNVTVPGLSNTAEPTLPTSGIPLWVAATNLGTSTATAATISGLNYISGGGTAQAQTATYSPAIAALKDGLQICWKPAASNTGAAPTFSPNGLTAHSLVKAGGAALVANDLTTTAAACAVYDLASTQWELQNPQTTASGGASSSFLDYQGPAGNVPIANGSDTVIFSTTIPGSTIPAGKCISIGFTTVTNPGTNSVAYKVNYGSSSASLFAHNANQWIQSLAPWVLCNNAGVTNAQTFTAVSFTAQATSLSGTTSFQYTMATDSTTSQTLTLTGNANGTGSTVTPKMWTITKLF